MSIQDQAERLLLARLKRRRGKRKLTYDERNTKKKRSQNQKESLDRVKAAQKKYYFPETEQQKL